MKRCIAEVKNPMKCKHKYEEQERYEYIDYCGYRVIRIVYRCKYCKKTEGAEILVDGI